MFKKGDKIVALRSTYSNESIKPAYIEGEQYTVSRQVGEVVYTELDSKGSSTNGWEALNFRKVVGLQELLAKAKELYDKGLITGYGGGIDTKGEKRITVSPTLHRMRVIAEGGEEEGLKYLQSLEVETFKIETVYDLDKIVLSRKPKVTLLNGFECLLREAVHNTDRGRLFDVTNLQTNRYSRLDYTSLKGATVTQ